MINIVQNKRKNLANELLPDLTPLLDVVFMLIVFLILTINSTIYSLDVKLPKDQENISNLASENKNIAIYLLPLGKGWKIDEDEFLDEKDFKNRLKELSSNNQDPSIMILSDKDAPISKLIDLMTFLEKIEVKKVNIAVEKQMN